MKRLPTSYIVALAVLVAIATIALLVFFGVPPFDNLQVFLLATITSYITLLVLGVVGGAFVGMLLAHRMLGNRDFSPFERDVLNSLQDIRDRLDRLEGGPSGEEKRLRR